VPPDKDVELVWKRPPESLWKILTGKVEEAVFQAFLTPEEIEPLNLIFGVRPQILD